MKEQKVQGKAGPAIGKSMAGAAIGGLGFWGFLEAVLDSYERTMGERIYTDMKPQEDQSNWGGGGILDEISPENIYKLLPWLDYEGKDKAKLFYPSEIKPGMHLSESSTAANSGFVHGAGEVGISKSHYMARGKDLIKQEVDGLMQEGYSKEDAIVAVTTNKTLTDSLYKKALDESKRPNQIEDKEFLGGFIDNVTPPMSEQYDSEGNFIGYTASGTSHLNLGTSYYKTPIQSTTGSGLYGGSGSNPRPKFNIGDFKGLKPKVEQ